MTTYEMRISDWSSDVCSSDLRRYRDIVAFLEILEQRLACVGDEDQTIVARPSVHHARIDSHRIAVTHRQRARPFDLGQHEVARIGNPVARPEDRQSVV